MLLLATIAFSFAAGVFLAVYLPWDGWHLWGAVFSLLLAVIVLAILRKHKRLCKRIVVILCAFGLSLAYVTGYSEVIVQPVIRQCGEEAAFSGVVTDYPMMTDTGAKVTIRLTPFAKAVYYGDEELLPLQPGQRISGTAHWQDAGHIHDTEVTTLTSKGVYALLYGKGDPVAEDGKSAGLFFLPQRAAHKMKEQIGKIWDDKTTAGFIMAEITGDSSGMSTGDRTAVSEVGLAHLFAVSGLHCAFLVSLLGFIIPPRRRRLLCGVGIGVLLFYMTMVGLTPSVVRACIMQSFIMLAPLFKRDSDPVTALGAALLVILLHNPFAAASISLQLSFAATAGILCISGKVHQFTTAWMKGKKKLPGVAWTFFMANVSSCVGALLFTVPLTAFYFNTFTLVSPLSNLLCVAAAGWNFMIGFITVLLSFFCLPLAKIMGWIPVGLTHYVLWMAKELMKLPFYALYFSNRLLKYWLVYLYAIFAVCYMTPGRKRKYAVATVLASAMLVLTVFLNTLPYHTGDLGVMALNVGQGESVLLYAKDDAILVDCGSSNGYMDPGGRTADRIGSMGYKQLKAVVVSHYHADHTNGLYEVLERIPVTTLYLPEIADEYGVKDRLLSIAEEKGIEVAFVKQLCRVSLAENLITVYPPVGTGDLNEQGLSVLCSSGGFDVLITGDMAGSTEKKFVSAYNLPHTEVLVVSHHGSSYSSCDAFLDALRPEAAIISVGDNSYGHPAAETLERLHRAGIKVYRTDENGNIQLTVHEGVE
ncbi:MAG: DNA internalization-related competence protein ComEC/Rec2 [Eubacteriales bacterium]|nr:DNA internalization-related competence protein ComEC/Rec2 [Eubacteriales bacterium]